MSKIKLLTRELTPIDQLACIIAALIVGDALIIANIPLLGQAIALILAILLPGFLILRILNVANVNRVEKIVLAVGLGISFLLFSGLLFNLACIKTGIILKPLSFAPLLILLNASIVGLSLVAYFRNALPPSIKLDNYRASIPAIISPVPLFLLLILALGILGGLTIRTYANTIFSLVAIVLIALFSILVGLRVIPKKYYPLAIFLIALTLLLCRSLISSQLSGSDISYEYYGQQIVQMSGYWNPLSSGYSTDTYTLLSSTILPTIFSVLLRVDVILVYQIVFPLLFALVPPVLYVAYQEQVGDTDGFLSAFFFVSFFTFFSLMLSLPRQQVAELFLVLVVLLLVKKQMQPAQRSVLLIFFLASLVVSHNGITYLFFIFGLFLLLSYVVRADKRPALTASVILIFITFALAWSILVTQGSGFEAYVRIGQKIAFSAIKDLFSLGTSDTDVSLALGIQSVSVTVWHRIHQLLQITAQGLIILGVVLTALKRSKKIYINSDFFVLSLASLLTLGLSIAIPAFVLALNANRIYQIALIFLSPFVIVGLSGCVDFGFRFFKGHSSWHPQIRAAAVLIFLVPYFLFNSGFVYEITERTSNFQIPFEATNIEHLNCFPTNWSYVGLFIVPKQDVYAAKWAGHNMEHYLTYADGNTLHELVGYGLVEVNRMRYLSQDVPIVSNHSYIYVGYRNVHSGDYYDVPARNVTSKLAYITPSLSQTDKIYSNGGSDLYYS